MGVYIIDGHFTATSSLSSPIIIVIIIIIFFFLIIVIEYNTVYNLYGAAVRNIQERCTIATDKHD